MTTTNYIKYLITFILCLFSSFSYAQWHDTGTLSAWPASNHYYYAGIIGASQSISIVRGSEYVDIYSTDWSFLYSNVMQRGDIQLVKPTSGLWNLLTEKTNIWIKTAVPPGTSNLWCDVAIVITNNVVETNVYFSVASRLRPALINESIPWGNIDGLPINCRLSNIPQIAGYDYTELNISTNSIVGGVTNIVVITNSYPAINKNLNVYGVWVYDAALASDERQSVSYTLDGIDYYLAMSGTDFYGKSYIWQRLPADVHMATAINLPFNKKWMAAKIETFANVKYCDLDGSFKTICDTIVTNYSWINTKQIMWDGSVIFTNPPHWQPTFTYLYPPTYATPLYYNGDIDNLSFIQPTQFASPVPFKNVFTHQVGLPQQIVYLITTNYDNLVDGWRLGNLLTNQMRVSVEVVTNLVFYANYFDWTPQLHYKAPATGLGYIVTNNWIYKNYWKDWNQDDGITNITTNILYAYYDTSHAQASFDYILSAPQTISNVTYSGGRIHNSVFNIIDSIQTLSFTNWWSTNIVGGVTNIISNTNSATVGLKVIATNYITDGDKKKLTMLTNVVVLLDEVLTNKINYHITSLIATNTNVKIGGCERDYDWDGIKMAMGSLIKVILPLTWYNTEGNVHSRYATNITVSDLIDTNLLGSFLPQTIITDTVVHAASAFVFTNTNIQLLPFAYNVVTSELGGPAPPPWKYVVYQGWMLYAEKGYVFQICDADTNGTIYHCEAAPAINGPSDLDNVAAQIWNYGVQCGAYKGSIKQADGYHGILVRSGSFGLPHYECGEGVSFWKDSVSTPWLDESRTFYFNLGPGYPTVINYERMVTTYRADLQVNQITGEPIGGSATVYNVYYWFSTENLKLGRPDDYISLPSNTVNVGLSQQSSIGVYSDIDTNFTSKRSIYLSGDVPNNIPNMGVIDTNILPVLATVGSNATPVYINQITNYWCQCVNGIPSGVQYPLDGYQYADNTYSRVLAFILGYVTQWNYKITTFPSPITSNYFVNNPTATNSYKLTTNVIWKVKQTWVGGWDGWDTNNWISKYGLFNESTSSTNLVTVKDFVSDTPILAWPKDTNNPNFYGVKDGLIILDFSGIGGFKFK